MFNDESNGEKILELRAKCYAVRYQDSEVPDKGLEKDAKVYSTERDQVCVAVLCCD